MIMAAMLTMIHRRVTFITVSFLFIAHSRWQGARRLVGRRPASVVSARVVLVVWGRDAVFAFSSQPSSNERVTGSLYTDPWMGGVQPVTEWVTHV
jgi:hypothetical protein